MKKGKPARGIRVEMAQVGDSSSRFRTMLAGVAFHLPAVPEFDLADDAVTTGADGVFEFSSVREGGWTIRASSECNTKKTHAAISSRQGSLAC